MTNANAEVQNKKPIFRNREIRLYSPSRDGSLFQPSIVTTLKTKLHAVSSDESNTTSVRRLFQITPFDLSDPGGGMNSGSGNNVQPFYYNDGFLVWDKAICASVKCRIAVRINSKENLFLTDGAYVVAVITPTGTEDSVLDETNMEAKSARIGELLKFADTPNAVAYAYIPPTDATITGRPQTAILSFAIDPCKVQKVDMPTFLSDTNNEQAEDTSPVNNPRIQLYLISGNGGSWGNSADKIAVVRCDITHTVIFTDKSSVSLSEV